jgi:hypothetical protein
MNLKFLKVKTKLQVQASEYVNWKKERGSNVAESIADFIEFVKKNSIEEVRPVDIINYYAHIKEKLDAKYFVNLAMKDLRVMFRWFKARKYDVIDPDIIGDNGLTFELEGAIIPQMTETKRLGRPPKIEIIKKVKSLRDINKLSFREIARVVKKDVSQVHVWYYYELPNQPL